MKKMEPIIRRNKLNLLAIHLRRGDYLSNNHYIHGIILEKYLYKEAKKFFLKKKILMG